MDTIVCPTCHGVGEVEFANGVFADTLRLLRRQKQEISGTDLAAVDGCTVQAMCNRLKALERLGFATSRRYGKKRLYKAVRMLAAKEKVT